MKKIILLLLACSPLWIFAQEGYAIESNDSQEELEAPKQINQTDRLEEAMVNIKAYLDQLSSTRSRSRREAIIDNIESLVNYVDEVASESADNASNNIKANSLLKHLFPDKSLTELDANDAVWVQGPNGKYAVIDGFGELQSQGDNANGPAYVWESPGQFNGSMALAKKGGLHYFVDNKGKASENGYDFIHKTNLPQMFALQRTSQNKFIESTLNPSTGSRLNNIQLLRKGFYSASSRVFPFEKNGLWGLVDTQGEILTEETYQYVGNIHGGYAKAYRINEANNDTTWGFLHYKDGSVNEAWDGLQYSAIGDFADGIAWVQKGKNFSLIFGTEEFEFSQGIKGPAPKLDRLYKDHYSGQINDRGLIKRGKDSQPRAGAGFETLFKLPYGIKLFKKPGESRVIEKFKLKDRVGLMDRSGKTIIDAIYDSVSLVQEIHVQGYPRYKVFQTQKNVLSGIVVLRGEPVPGTKSDTAWVIHRTLETNFEEIGEFRPGFKYRDFDYVRARRGKKWGYVFWDLTSLNLPEPTRTIPLRYDVATDFRHEDDDPNKPLIARVFIKKYDLFFYINTAGEMLVEIETESLID